MAELTFSTSLNPLYLYEAVQDQMRSSFEKSKPSVLLLTDFLTSRSYEAFARIVGEFKETRVEEPDRLFFSSLAIPQAQRAFFASPSFFDFVRNATGVKPRDVKLEARRFGHRDFTLLHDDQLSSERFVFFYTLTSDWNASSGGSIVFSFGDAREPLIFEPKANSLIILKVPKGMREFVKYINHTAGNKTITYISGELLVR